MLTGTGHHHCFGTTANLVAGMGAEMFDDDFDLLGDLVIVKLNKPRKLTSGLAARHFWISLDLLDQFVVALVAGVVRQHIVNETFLNGLPHAVLMERRFTIRTGFVENGQRFELRRCRKGKETQIGLLGTLELLPQQFFLRILTQRVVIHIEQLLGDG
ncbi:hypothetical protein D3C77_452550 [compost metagenome]